VVVRAAWSPIRHREPTWRRQQCRHRGGRTRAPDGYTLLVVSASNAFNATLYDNLSFNFIRDIAPVASIMRVPNVMEVNPSFPAKTVPEFIAYAIGGTTHVFGELFKAMAGVDLVPVYYRGSGPAVVDLLGGQVQVIFDPIVASIQYIRAGKLRALAVTSAARSAVSARYPDFGRIFAGL
jgi:tripartite-type tricarboxylate transporter receptor subunit TctC